MRSRRAYLSFPFELSNELLSPRLLLFTCSALVFHLAHPLPFDILTNGAQRLPKIILVPPDNDLKFADGASLVRDELVLLILRRICRQGRTSR